MRPNEFKFNDKNPLSDLIPDEIYEKLYSRGFINEKSVRDYIIRKKFEALKAQNIPASKAIELIREDYPYLQFDTIRKIIYQTKK
ncbi:hypothetical protein MROS_1789 [Melioribacter roseus P3M-2]|jgi:hypothetical protein|uniref:Regulatory protein RecX n=1 Tax=Melioribacter roseus (strain DSM 23840 / JCM 17771 / VKM B-2668 / P3M-2) TaxID=1191523 RepID=I7A1D9_MELRP|nr:hypothetical protein [Melioribacter roseus]AFN75023.1 hypothetical protein MROS_1789 [Melioribacter roseus P3M-2]